MSRSLLLLLLLLLLFFSPSLSSSFSSSSSPSSFSSSSSPSSDAILLEDIKTLTLHQTRQTTGRRVSPVAQLTCSRGDACAHVALHPEVMQCQNMGSDGTEVQWKCEADLDDKVRLGGVHVVCEGYRDRNDPYVLKGSCGVEYELRLTEKGRERFRSEYFTFNSSRSERSYWGNFVWIVWLIVFGIIFYNFLLACFRPAAPIASAPPAPGIGFRPDAGYPPYGNTPYGNTGSGLYPPVPGCDPITGAPYPHYPPQPQPSGGGFWTGAATGGLMGFLFGRNRGYRTGGYYGTSPSYGSSYSASSYGAPTRSSPSSSSSSSRTSTGYGGSSRR